jgi:hypothetical protein
MKGREIQRKKYDGNDGKVDRKKERKKKSNTKEDRRNGQSQTK